MSSYQPVTGVVTEVRRVGTSFMRVVVDCPSTIGSDYAVLDQRIKLVFPPGGADKFEMPTGENWYQNWLAIDEAVRGVLRTYSIREQQLLPNATRYAIDFVLHGLDDPDHAGPATLWAANAKVGDKLIVVGPVLGQDATGGIAFKPGSARHVILIGDETAVPAIARILADIRQCQEGAGDESLAGIESGRVIIEVPLIADVEALRQDIAIPDSFEVMWLPREMCPSSTEAGRGWLVKAVLADVLHDTEQNGRPEASDEAVHFNGELIWETPEEVTAREYLWIAGESGVVRTLRRRLVNDAGYDKSQISFMGYWKKS